MDSETRKGAQGAEESNSTKISGKFTSVDVTSLLVMRSCYAYTSGTKGDRENYTRRVTHRTTSTEDTYAL